MNKIDKIYESNNGIKEFASEYVKYVNSVIQGIANSKIDEFVSVILNAREKQSTIYFIGNGGSASTASHFANDISIGTREHIKPFRAISLCDNQAITTAIANDDGFDYIFSDQLSVLIKKEDVLVAISASGNSINLINAVAKAKELGATSVGITSFDGGKLKKIVDVSIHIPTGNGEYGPAEDSHLVIDHLVSNYLQRYVKSV